MNCLMTELTPINLYAVLSRVSLCFSHSNRVISFVLVFARTVCLFTAEKSSLGLHVRRDMEVSQTHSHTRTQYKDGSGW